MKEENTKLVCVHCGTPMDEAVHECVGCGAAECWKEVVNCPACEQGSCPNCNGQGQGHLSILGDCPDCTDGICAICKGTGKINTKAETFTAFVAEDKEQHYVFYEKKKRSAFVENHNRYCDIYEVEVTASTIKEAVKKAIEGLGS